MPKPARPGRIYGGLSEDERRADRRRRLMETGLERYGTIGFHKTTIPQLCSGAGVTARHFYDEFPTREALLRAVYDEVAAGAIEAVLVHLRDPAIAVRERILHSTHGYFRYMTSDPRRARVYAIETMAASPELQLHARGTREIFAKTLARAAEAERATGALEGLDARLLGVAMSGAAFSVLVEWVLADPKPPAERMAATVAQLWTRTLLVP